MRLWRDIMKGNKKNDDYPLNIQRINHFINRELISVHMCPCCGQPMNIGEYASKVWRDK